jgi:predicted nuclease with TOPRIM domain
MDLSIVVFDLRDAIEELREERAELLKRIEALEASLADASPTAVRAIGGGSLLAGEREVIHHEVDENNDRKDLDHSPQRAERVLELVVGRVSEIEAGVSDPVNGILHSGILPRGGTQ